MNEEMKRNPRPANLRTGRTSESVEEKQKNEKFFSFHIGEISFHAGDADGKCSINLSGGLDVEYNATTTEEKKRDVEKELADKIGVLFDTLKSITPPPTPTTPNATPTVPTTATPTPSPTTTSSTHTSIPTPKWDPWVYKSTCSQPVSPATPAPEPVTSAKVDSVEKRVAPKYSNSTNAPEIKPTEKTITREEYKRLLNSIYGIMEGIDQLKRAVEKLSSNK